MDWEPIPDDVLVPKRARRDGPKRPFPPDVTVVRLLLAAPIKELGSHTAAIKLHSDVETELKFEVVSENPIEDSAGSQDDADEDDE